MIDGLTLTKFDFRDFPLEYTSRMGLTIICPSNGFAQRLRAILGIGEVASGITSRDFHIDPRFCRVRFEGQPDDGSDPSGPLGPMLIYFSTDFRIPIGSFRDSELYISDPAVAQRLQALLDQHTAIHEFMGPQTVMVEQIAKDEGFVPLGGALPARTVSDTSEVQVPLPPAGSTGPIPFRGRTPTT